MTQKNKKANFLDSWTDLFDQSSPHDYLDYPKENHPEIISWKRHIIYTDVWLAICANDIILKDYFYCTSCNKWMTYRGNGYFIERHTSTHQLLEKNDSNSSQEAEKDLPQTSILFNVKKNLKSYLILSGAPFSHIEDPYLKLICPNLPSRQQFVKEIEEISSKTQIAIKKELESLSNICIAFDEWEDSSRRRYLGITAVGTSNIRVSTYTLALVPLLETSVNASYISQCVIQTFEKYDILNKVRVVVTDSASVMIAASNFLSCDRLPCICHIFNLLIGAFLKAESSILETLTFYQNEFSTSKFLHLLKKKKLRKKKSHLILVLDGILLLKCFKTLNQCKK